MKVRCCNTSALYRLVRVQRRSHRKLLIIDGETVLTGGRNIGNDYCDLSDHYKFLDADLEISGPSVKQVLESLDVYWHSPLASEPGPTETNVQDASSSYPPCCRPGRQARTAGDVYRESTRSMNATISPSPSGEASPNVFNAIVNELRTPAEVSEAPSRDDECAALPRRICTRGVPCASSPIASLHGPPTRGCALSLARLTAQRLTLRLRRDVMAPAGFSRAKARSGLDAARGDHGETTLLGTYNIDAPAV